MKLNLIQPIQFSAIALLAGLTLVGCGTSEVTDPAPETSEGAVEEPASGAEAAVSSEGKTYLGAMVRGQQAYYLEAGEFSSNLEDLGLGLESETAQYTYAITEATDTQVLATATAKQDGLKSYSAAAFASEDTTFKGVCEADAPGATPPDAPELSGSDVSCPAGSTLVD